jgi:hypothetical protein
VASYPTCYGGEKVGYLGVEGTLAFNNVTAATAGACTVTIIRCDRSGPAGRRKRQRRSRADTVVHANRQLHHGRGED